jgi:hypothetical protein
VARERAVLRNVFVCEHRVTAEAKVCAACDPIQNQRTPSGASTPGAVVGESRSGEAVELSASDVLFQSAVPLSRVELGKPLAKVCQFPGRKVQHFAFDAFDLGHDQVSRWPSVRVPND